MLYYLITVLYNLYNIKDINYNKMSTVVQCSGCGLCSCLGEFPRSIIGKKCGGGCDGINEEVLFEKLKPQTYFTKYNNEKLLNDLKNADNDVDLAIKKRNKLYSKWVKNKLIS